MIELDHIFIFTSVGAPEAEALTELGLEEGSGNTHPGQGTSNRRFFFEQNFLELLWVHDEEEVRSALIAPTRLWERSRSEQTGYSPIGLCVRPSKQKLTEGEPVALPETWNYKPPYLPADLKIDVADNGSTQNEPMLFQIPFGREPSDGRMQQAAEVRHPLGIQTITKVILHTPDLEKPSAAMTQLLATDWLSHERTQAIRLTIEFDHCRQQQVANFAPQLPLTIKW